MAFLLSCEKDSGLIGLDTLSESRGRVGVLKQFKAVSFNLADDSILTTNPTRAIVGSVQDPEIGYHKASFVTHLLLESAQPNFGTNPILDSARLFLRYVGAYGDTLKPMNVKVYALDEYMDPDEDQLYYSNKTWNKGTFLGETGAVSHYPRTFVSVSGDTLSPRMIIPMDVTYLQQKIIDGASSSSAEFIDNDVFIEYFNGLLVESGGEDGSFLYLDAVTGVSRMQLFYHNDTDTNVFQLETDNSGTTVNHFEHDYTTASFNVDNPDVLNGELYTYVQAMGGVLTAIEFPDLGNLADSAFLINKAELVLSVEIGADANGLNAPQQLLVLELGDDSTKVLIKDYNLGASAGIGGTIIRGEYRQKEYRFNITRHIFDRINKENSGTRLFLVAGGGASTSNQVKLNGNLHPVNPLTLDIYFSQNL